MNNRKNISSFLRSSMSIALMTIFMMTCSTAFGQGWETFYGGNNTADAGAAIVQTNDGGFAIAGYSNLNIMEVIRTDQNGNIEWTQNYFGQLGLSGVLTDILQTADNGFILAGTAFSSGAWGEKDFVLIKIDENGNQQWVQYYGTVLDEECHSIQQTLDGGYILAGEATNNGNNDAFIIKTFANGNVQWQRYYGSDLDDTAHKAIQTTDGGFIVVGATETVANADTDFYIIKTDALGNITWENNYSQTFNDVGLDIVQLNDGSYVAVGFEFDTAALLKIDADGNNEDWVSFNLGGFQAIEKTSDDNLIMTGFTEESISVSSVYVVKTQLDGTLIWSQTFGREGGGIKIATGSDIKNTIDGGYVITGSSGKVPTWFDNDTYLIKVNQDGEIYTNFIEGTVFDDINENCIQDTGEPILEDWVVEAKGEKSFYGTTDENGKYSIIVANGDYEVSLFKPSENYQPCFNTFNATLNGVGDTITRLFPVQEINTCPLLQVDISTTLLEKCHYTDYVVRYSNLGTNTATDAEVKVSLDDFLIFNSAELPFTNETIDGDLYYVFNIGDVDPLESGSFKINVLVDCVEPQLQQTHCVTALIFPDTLCEANNPAWDESSLKLTGTCDADSVRFNIINTGEDMEEGRSWIVIEDEVMLFQEPESIELEAGASRPLAYEANGSTYRLIAEQSQNHPGASFPTLALEGCVPDNSTFSTGFHTMFPEDDNDLSKSVDCQENVDADEVPDNYKNAYPKGYNNEHCITNTTEINYHIRFQNTGVDSVDRVIVRDTLSDLFDISTVELGASSHDYTFEIYDERILKFTFDNIMLPDSSTNEVASNGFVKFRVSQKPENPPGTIIYNSAAIYFDFDEWINTDETFHEICEGEWWDIIDVSTTAIFIPEVNINVFPNPFMETATFQLTGLDFKEVTFNVFDLQGRLIRSEYHNGNEFQFDRNQLSSGMYVYRIESEGKPVAVGKIVIE